MIEATLMELVAGFAVALVLLAAEYLLCTKLKSPLWGGVIPCLILGGTVWLFTGGPVPPEMRYVFPFVVLNTVFFGEWATGREKYEKIQQRQLERMRAKDM